MSLVDLFLILFKPIVLGAPFHLFYRFIWFQIDGNTIIIQSNKPKIINIAYIKVGVITLIRFKELTNILNRPW